MRLKNSPTEDRASKENESILIQIKQTQKEIDRVYDMFQNQTDEDMLESCIYQLQALKAKQNFLIRSAKANKLHACRELFGAGLNKSNA